jgi:serine/threonine-protein kinase
LSADFPVPDGVAPGTRVAGYLIEEPLGSGGMAVVYRARDERLGRPVALKVLAPGLAADEEFRRRFAAESRAAAAVDHPHIIPVYEAGQAGLTLFIAMRLVTGGDLRGVLAREGPLPPERAARFLSPVASALDAAHRAGLVHRDVKPGNVLVDADPGRPEHVYLSDFGISKGAASSAGLTGTGQYLGTPDYTSPEQARGLPVDGRTDQYALACLAWHLLTGTLPFERDDSMAVLYAHLYEPPPPLDALRPGLPAAAGQVLGRALAKEPGERYASCGEFAEALREALALPPYQPVGPAPAGPAVAWHPGTRASGLLGHAGPATVGKDGYSGGPVPDPPPAATPVTPVIPATTVDAPTRTVAVPRRRGWPGSGPGGNAARRRRYLAVTLAGTFLAAGTAVALVLATAGTPRPSASAGPGDGSPSARASSRTTAPATPSRSRAATATATRTAKPVILTGTLDATLSNPASQGVRAVAFGAGSTLAAGAFSNTSTVYLWDTATRTITATLTGAGGKQVNAVAFAPGGAILAAGDFSGRTYLWDTATGRLTATLTDPGSMGVFAVAIAPDGTAVAVGDGNGCAVLWDIAPGVVTDSYCGPTGGGVGAVAFAPGGTTLAVGAGGGGWTYLWNTANGKNTASFRIDSSAAQVNAVAFSPDGATLAAGAINGRTYLWDPATGKLTATLADPASKGVNSVAFGPAGTLAVGDQNGSTYLWDTATGKLLATLTDPASQGAISVAFNSADSTLAVGDQNGSVYLWRIAAHSP